MPNGKRGSRGYNHREKAQGYRALLDSNIFTTLKFNNDNDVEFFVRELRQRSVNGQWNTTTVDSSTYNQEENRRRAIWCIERRNFDDLYLQRKQDVAYLITKLQATLGRNYWSGPVPSLSSTSEEYSMVTASRFRSLPLGPVLSPTIEDNDNGHS